jgi:AraC-type DNA-binding domain-containing proteins
MIEILNGIKETVNFKENTGIRLYDNDMNEYYPNHWHTPLEIIMPVKSNYTAICSDIEFNLKEGDVLLINPGVVHSLPATPVGERFIFQADFSLLHNIKELESTLSIIAPALVITEENFPSIHSRIENIMYAIKEEYFSNAPLIEASIYAKLIDMFVLIGREYTTKADMFHVTNTKQREYTEKFLSLCNYINENCTKDLTLDEVADLAGFSKYHFTRLFRQFTGVSFYKYLNQKKIAIAENLLIDPDISVTEVALRSGFSSLSAFIRMFKIIKSCTPTEFRNMYNHIERS